MRTSKRKKILLALAVSVVLPMQGISAAGEPAELNADTVEYDMSTGLATANGGVTMTRGTSGSAGNVQYQDPGRYCGRKCRCNH